jgi:hypothetical protein
MLDAYIIDEIKKREEMKKESERPRLYIRIDDRPTRKDIGDDDYKIEIPLYDREQEESGPIIIPMYAVRNFQNENFYK